MIITEKIEITVMPNNIKYFQSLGYSIKNKQKIEIPIIHLTPTSKFLVNVKCDICNKEKIITYSSYYKNINRCGYYSCSPKCGNNKTKINNFKKYGDVNYNNSSKNKETCLRNYGVENPSQSIIIQKIKTENYFKKHGFMPPSRTELDKYRAKVKHLTDKNKKELLEKWDGYDFYDGEYIKDNFNLGIYHKNYPTIDHKISVFYGFLNNMSPEEISKIQNLCFTKRTLNIKKHKNCYEGKKEN